MSVEIHPFDGRWVHDFAALSARIQLALGDLALAVEHIGSTAVEGLPAKDVIDVQVAVARLDEEVLVEAFKQIGFSLRSGDWNQRDHVPPGDQGPSSAWDKLVFAPPEGERPSNVHVRLIGNPNRRYALLFRDFLNANEAAAAAWAEFKIRLAARVVDLQAYGQVKDPATDVLLVAAEQWAADTAWAPPAPIASRNADPS